MLREWHLPYSSGVQQRFCGCGLRRFLGMTTKFVEVTITHKYREKDEHGEVNGGAWYVLEKRLNMKWLAVIFAIATVICVFGTGNLPQSNSMASGMETSFGIPGWATSGLMALLLAAVIIGGIKRIARVTSILVPFMAILYVIGALLVLFQNYATIPEAFASIFSTAFTGSAAVGGFLGASFAYAFTKGVGRGLFSNEAGQGSAPIAHASAKGRSSGAGGISFVTRTIYRYFVHLYAHWLGHSLYRSLVG